jgi:5-formyltetrahydrofolate cyclo-ligase
VVVPGLAFDSRGYRLGYGAGAFDRFLAGRRVLTVGFGYDLQIVDRVPVEAHDVPVGWLVTESRALETGQEPPGGGSPMRETRSR